MKRGLMKHIRPFRIFTLIDASSSDHIVRLPIPARRGLGSISLLETFLIIATAKLVGATRIFEFGTFFGSTTLNLALNVPEDAEIFTLDLGREQTTALQQHPADALLTSMHLGAENMFEFLGDPVSRKITTLTGDSTKFDFSPWKDSIDLVFIDGGHDLATVRSDTDSASRVIRKDKPSCILWHDYGNLDCSDLTAFLDEQSQQLDIFHVEDTMLCVWFNGSCGDIRTRLRA